MSEVSASTNGADRWTPYLRLLARVLLEPQLHNRVDLSGIIQQTLLDAHQTDPGLLAGPTDASTAWMRRVLANNLHDELRKLRAEKREIGREVRLDDAMQSSAARVGAWLAAADSTPSMAAMRHERALEVAAALERLPADQREAVVLHHWHGWKLDRIASHMERTKAAVAGLLKRGLRGLRSELSDRDAENF